MNEIELTIALGLMAWLFGTIWLLARGFKDAAFLDPWLFLTGISLVGYVFSRWDRAKSPFLIAVIGFGSVVVAPFIGNSSPDQEAFDRGLEAMDQEDYELAVECFSEAISIVSDDSASYYNRGLAHSNLGQFEAAVADFSEVIRLEPGDDDALALRAEAYRELADEELAQPE